METAPPPCQHVQQYKHAVLLQTTLTWFQQITSRCPYDKLQCSNKLENAALNIISSWYGNLLVTEVSYKLQTGWFRWIIINTLLLPTCFFSALLLLVGRQEGRPEHKKLGVGLLVVTVWPSFACFIAPAVTTSSIILLSFNKIQHGDILVPANLGPPGKWPLKWRGIFFLSYQITNLQVKRTVFRQSMAHTQCTWERHYLMMIVTVG